jgi:hypothetical protein
VSSQSIKVIPDVEVYSTVKGVRHGRDDVLEKGIEALMLKIPDTDAADRSR